MERQLKDPSNPLSAVTAATMGADRAALADVLGCHVDDAAQTAGNLLTHPQQVVASAAAVWTSPAARLSSVLSWDITRRCS